MLFSMNQSIAIPVPLMSESVRYHLRMPGNPVSALVLQRRRVEVSIGPLGGRHRRNPSYHLPRSLEIRLQSQGLREFHPGPRQVSEVQQRVSEVVVGLRIVGLDLKRVPVFPDGL